jgi:hypothetical protein
MLLFRCLARGNSEWEIGRAPPYSSSEERQYAYSSPPAFKIDPKDDDSQTKYHSDSSVNLSNITLHDLTSL